MRRTSSFIVILCLLTASASAAPLRFVPLCGVSIPAGDRAEEWRVGYTVGLEVARLGTGPVSWGGRIAVHRWKPNAEEMLRVGSRELFVETDEGWNALFDLFVLARYRDLEGVWFDGGAGLVYRCTSDVEVVGVHPYGATAVNRQINRPGGSEVVPALTVGLSADLAKVLRPELRYHRFFTADGGTDVFSVTVGLLAR